MPQGDGTGPNGQGPMTGRGMGYCAGFNSPGFMNSGFRGFRRRAGMGRGRRFWRAAQVAAPIVQTPFIQQPIPETEEKEILKEELADLKQEIKEIEKRLKELED